MFNECFIFKMQLISKYLPIFRTSCWDMLESWKNFESESLPFWEMLLLVSKGSTNSVSDFSSAVCQPWPCRHFQPGTPRHGGSVHYRIFSKVLDLYPLEANSIPPTCDCKKISRHCHMPPGEQYQPIEKHHSWILCWQLIHWKINIPQSG